MMSKETSLSDLALMFKALGDPTRLRIFDFLRAQCCPVAVGEDGEVRSECGPTAGEVCCHLTGQTEINSTISHHLKELRLAKLITMERRGKTMVCGINQEAVWVLAAFLSQSSTDTEIADCCG